MRPRQWISVLFTALGLAAVGFTASCGDDTPSVSMSTTPSSTTPSSITSVSPAPSSTEPAITDAVIEVVADRPYLRTTDGAVRHLDIYRPIGADDPPLVVVFHANPVFGHTKASVERLATLIAQRGAVVVAPTYGSPLPLNDMSVVADTAAGWFREEGPCAVWAAIELAGEFGADPDELVLVGETTGTFPAQMALFDPPAAVAGCDAAPVVPTVERAILFESGGFLMPDLWDGVLAAEPDTLAELRPWAHLGNPTSTRIVVLAGEIEADEATRSLGEHGYRESDWVRQRDPHLAFAGFFETHRGLDDGSMSSIDVSEVMVDVMREAGWNAEFDTVAGVGHALTTEESKQLVADLVFGG